MMKFRQTTAKPKPISAPVNWQTANLTRLREIVENHPDWVEETARSFGRLPIEELKETKPTRLGDIIALLNAQAIHWRKLAYRLETPENRAQAKKEQARSIAEKLMAHGKFPNASRLAQEMSAINVEISKASLSHWGLVLYNWAASSHESTALRSALGYSESQFRVLAHKEMKQLERLLGTKYQPMFIERKGQTTLYSPMVACGLLIHKLAKINRTKRWGLIKLLLQFGKLPPQLRKFLSPRRS